MCSVSRCAHHIHLRDSPLINLFISCLTQPLQTLPKSRSNDSDLSERGELEKEMVEEWRELGDTLFAMMKENEAMIRRSQEEIIAKNRILQQSITDLEHQQELLEQKSKKHAEIVAKIGQDEGEMKVSSETFTEEQSFHQG